MEVDTVTAARLTSVSSYWFVTVRTEDLGSRNNLGSCHRHWDRKGRSSLNERAVGVCGDTNQLGWIPSTVASPAHSAGSGCCGGWRAKGAWLQAQLLQRADAVHSDHGLSATTFGFHLRRERRVENREKGQVVFYLDMPGMWCKDAVMPQTLSQNNPSGGCIGGRDTPPSHGRGHCLTTL